MKKQVSPIQRILNFWAIILIVWSIYRANFHLPEAVDELLIKPLVFILPVYFYLTRREKGRFVTGIDLNFRNWRKDIGIGLGIGLLFFLSGIMANYFKNHQHLVLPNQMITGIISASILALATGISEEILSRGFVLKRLYQESKNIFTSSFLASILFFFLHVPILFTNVKITGNTILFFMGTDMVLSLLISFIYLERKSLLPAILIHALYNLSIYFFV